MSQATAAPLVPGFEVGPLLGRGATGSVYRARELATDRDVALKWLPVSDPRDVTALRFEREARTAARVRHPNVVPILSAGATPRGRWIAMELVDGFPLATALGSRSLGPNAVAGLVAKLARGLAAVHAAGVVHRDVKPANVIVDDAGEPRLVDFGLARFAAQAGALTAPGMMLGTVAYMAPEVLDGGGAEAGPACDVYSLGAVLHEGLSGTPPFGGDAAAAVVERARKGKPLPLPPSVDPAVARLCEEMLARDPARRPSAGQVALRLEAIAAGAPLAPSIDTVADPAAKTAPWDPRPTVTGPPTLAEPPRRGSRKRTLAVVAGVVLALIAIGRARRRALAPPAPPPEPVADEHAAPVVDAPPPAPAPAPASAPVPDAAPVTTDRLRDLEECLAALVRDDRAEADRVARAAIAKLKAGETAWESRFLGVIGRDAVVDGRVDEGQRVLARALDLDPRNAQALFASFAGALIAGDAVLARTRCAELEARAPGSTQARAAEVLSAVARSAPGARLQLHVAAKADARLVRAVVSKLVPEPFRRK